MSPTEPTLAAFPNRALRYFAATRPAFLSVTLVGCLLGLATAAHDGLAISPTLAILTLFFALIAHAGANVINDFHDARNGTDAMNSQRVFPFTGGSRFIQNKVMSERETGIFGYALLTAVIPAGIWLTAHSAPGLVLIGLCGLLAGWAYSAPPLQLVSRGLGEGAIAAAWLLVVIGSDFVQRGQFAITPVVTGLGYSLLVANVLYINQFPDSEADAKAGKRTVVVRLGCTRARWGYVGLAAAANVWLLAQGLCASLPWPTVLITLSTATLSLGATRYLWQHASQPHSLAPAIKLTILGAVAHGLVLSAMLAFFTSL